MLIKAEYIPHFPNPGDSTINHKYCLIGCFTSLGTFVNVTLF